MQKKKILAIVYEVRIKGDSIIHHLLLTHLLSHHWLLLLAHHWLVVAHLLDLNELWLFLRHLVDLIAVPNRPNPSDDEPCGQGLQEAHAVGAIIASVGGVVCLDQGSIARGKDV